MKNYLLLSMFAIGLVFASCRKSNEIQPLDNNSFNGEIVAKKSGTPIQGSMTFQIATNYNLPCNCGQLLDAGTYYGTGNISHLGNTSSYIKPCIAPIFQGNVLAGYHVGIQCGTLTAANGDELHVYINPYNLMFTNAGAVGSVKIDVTGGTGRFSNASGSFTASTTNDGQGNVTLDNINGTIKY